MEALVKGVKGAHLRKIDIVKWSSDVAEQFGIDRLPTVWLYDGKERVADDLEAAWARLQRGS